jgi:hypothetical protein
MPLIPRAALGAVLVACLAPAAAVAGAPDPVTARAGAGLALDAARTWAPDAALIYLENDEPLDATGRAARWGYLFRSEALQELRVYSLEGDRIVVGGPPGFQFEAPPVAPEWSDSAQALAAADAAAGGKFREAHAGGPGAMLLTRGILSERDPDRTTWTVVYAASGVPSLFVVVDAVTGKVERTWRG